MVSLLDLEKYAKENNIPIMMSDGIEFLLEFIRKNNVKTILEIGSAIGYSAIRMALVDKNIKVTTIERDLKRYEEAVENIKDFDLEDQITIIYGDAFDIELEESFDLIFIDAAKSQYIKFFEKFKKNLNSKGFIVSDNLNFHGLTQCDESTLSKNVRGLVRKLNSYTEFLKNNREFDTEFYDLGDGVSISYRKEVIMKKDGFTLVELLGVIVILGIISLLIVPPLLNQINHSKNQIDDATKRLVLSSTDLYVDKNSDDFPRKEGVTKCLSFDYLIKAGYLSKAIVDVDGKNLSQTKSVKITYVKSSNNYKYEIVDIDKCEAVGGESPKLYSITYTDLGWLSSVGNGYSIEEFLPTTTAGGDLTIPFTDYINDQSSKYYRDNPYYLEVNGNIDCYSYSYSCGGAGTPCELTIYNIKSDIEIITDAKKVCEIVSGTGENMGDKIRCGENEYFYVLSATSDNIEMLAEYPLFAFPMGTGAGNLVKQNANSNLKLYFSDSGYWDSVTYPNYFVYDSNSLLYSYVEDYVKYLKSLGLSSASGTLIDYFKYLTLNQQESYNDNIKSWLLPSGMEYWTGSAALFSPGYVYVLENGHDNFRMFDSYPALIRPVINMSPSEIDHGATNKACN